MLGAGLVAVTGQPAAATVVRWDERTSWAYTDAHRPSKIYVDGSDNAPVGSWLDERGRKHTSRAYFTFDISRYRNAVIDSAVLTTEEASVADCAQRPTLELWRTEEITGRSSWKNPPRELAKLDTFVRPGQLPCPWPHINWDVADGLQQAIVDGRSTLTLALRLPAELEGDPAQAYHYRNDVGMSITFNRPPDRPTNLAISWRGPCVTAEPYPWLPQGPVRLSAEVTDPDEEEQGNTDRLGATFAVWPVDDPTARVERTSSTGDGSVWAEFPADQFGHDRTYAWAVRGSDGALNGDWSQTCYFRKDLEGPARAPTVASTDYPNDGASHDGTGIPGNFTLGANGVPEVQGFYYGLETATTYVAADAPGGTATISVTPQNSGRNRLLVRSVDQAGNTSAATSYEFGVRDVRPRLTGYFREIGEPTPFRFESRMPGVVEYRYHLDGDPVQTAPAGPDGTAEVLITASWGGHRTLTVTSRTTGGLEASAEQTFWLDSAPTIASEVYPENGFGGGQGVAGAFTFTPRMPDVVRYRYYINGQSGTVDAGADGTATLTWAPDEPGWYELRVASVSANGRESQERSHFFTVRDLVPTVWGDPYWSGDYPNGGPGQPGRFGFNSEAPDVTAYIYRFNDEPEQTVPAPEPYTPVIVEYTPEYGGRYTLTARSRASDGTLSPERVFTFLVNSAPLVHSGTYPSDTNSGLPGVPGAFTFTSQSRGVVSYYYRFDDEAEGRTVDAAVDGTASITWTPSRPGWRRLTVVGRTADGTPTDAREYSFSVRDPKPRIESLFYWESDPRGGIGEPGLFRFSTDIGDTVEYHYRLNGGAEQVVPVSDGSTAEVSITPDRGGQNVLSMRARTESGEWSPTVEVRFMVSTAPAIASETYPGNTYSGGPGVPGVFVFTSRVPEISQYVYRFDGGPEVSVDAGADGAASVTLSPPSGGWYMISVYGRTAAGTVTDVGYHVFGVLD
ncbi:RHS repeat domain-containing protein [Plantactinospora endophytica]|uniref:DNRLRE domain-containing protein n=1 Tax=Plantactinospora endophytica TaxID=673535 RepID=A0ABQ4E346_9ACTN|nr:hypothetical protein [Plantactinospora endophytica]GIG89122.1 hypothetical protein Pen02_40580 [Plantactinospora endophytica]